MRGRGLALRVAAVTAVAGLSVALGPAGAEAASTPHWQVSYRTHSATAAPLDSVTAPGKYDAWAVGVAGSGTGARPVVLHWNGTSWSKRAMPAGFLPALVESSSTSNVWVIGSTSAFAQEAMVWNGSKWNPVPVPMNLAYNPVAVLSRSDVWGSTGTSCAGGNNAICTSTVWHWNGAAWTSYQVKGFFEGLAGAGSHAWLVTLTHISNFNSRPVGYAAIYRTTGATLQRVAAPVLKIEHPAVAASPGGQVWMLASPGSDKNATLLIHWTGRTWTDARVPARVGSSEPFIIEDPFIYDGHDGVWAGAYAHWTGTKWINAFQVASMPGTDGFGLLALAVVPGSASVWAAGEVGRSPNNTRTNDSLIAVYGGVP
jgi:hypothetical protein